MRDSSSTRRLVNTAMLITMALILHFIEGLLPALPILGARLGLANIITVATIYLFGPKTAFTVAVGRSLLGALIPRGLTAFAMSFSGAVLSWAVMALLYRLFDKQISLIGMSLVGAIMHNIAQLIMASIILGDFGFMYLFPYLMFFAIPTGIMVGLVAKFLIKVMRSNPNFKNR